MTYYRNTIFLKAILFFIATNICFHKAVAQIIDKTQTCGTDTIFVDYYGIKFGNHIKYKAFKCHQVSNSGLRIDFGFDNFSYNAKTKSWLGDHNGGLLGLGLVLNAFTLSASFKLATITPKKDLEFNGELLTNEASLNPIKIEYGLGYTLNMKYNFALEPFVAYTRNSFWVINEEELNQTYKIDKIFSTTFGTSVNKYFKLTKNQFIV